MEGVVGWEAEGVAGVSSCVRLAWIGDAFAWGCEGRSMRTFDFGFSEGAWANERYCESGMYGRVLRWACILILIDTIKQIVKDMTITR